MEHLSEYPVAILVFVGLLVLSNIGVIVTFITFIFKAGIFVSETRTGIKQANEQAVSAHQRLNAIYRNSITLAASQNDINLLAETEGTLSGMLGDTERETLSCVFIAAATDIIRCVSGNGLVLDISQFRIYRIS